MKKKIRRIVNAMKRQSVMLRALSLVLTVVLIFYIVPSVVYAEIGAAFETDEDETAVGAERVEAETVEETIDPYAYVNEAYEVEELREESVKHFRLEDGSYVAAQYSEPVHYESDGTWQDIDNALYESSGGVYANSSARIKFAKKITGNETLFTLKERNTKLEMSLVGANKGVNGNVTNDSDAENDTTLQKLMNLENLSSRILYADVLEGVDLEYEVHSLNVKENLIVKERAEGYTYTFQLKLNNLTANLQASGNILLTDGDGNSKYVIPAPVVFDAAGSYAPTTAASYELVDEKNGKYLLTVSVSADWMNAEERVFPVTVDPAVRYNVTSASNAFTIKADGTESTDLEVSPTAKSYIMCNREFGPGTDYVARVRVCLKYKSSIGGVYVGAYPSYMLLDNTTTWEELNSYGYGSILDYQFIDSTATKEYYYWDVTDVVDYFVTNDMSGCGIVLDVASGTGSVQFHSALNASTAPYIITEYRNMNGVEDYWSSSTHNVGVAGSGSINVANGNLTFAIPTLSTTDSLMPYTPTLVYNTLDLGNNIYSYLPSGYRLNINESIVKRNYVAENGETKTYCTYTDADGTVHAFFEVPNVIDKYVDEDGLQKTMLVSTDEVTITDDSGIIRTFTAHPMNSTYVFDQWYLTSITDKNGNTVSFTFDSSQRPTTVSLTPVGSTKIDFLKLLYNTDGLLSVIYNTATNEAAVLRCSDLPNDEVSWENYYNYLRQIDFARGTSAITESAWLSFAADATQNTNITVDASAKYQYYNSLYCLLMSVEDTLTGYKVKYTTTGDVMWTVVKVTSVEEYSGETLGKSISYSYGTTYSNVTVDRGDEAEDLRTTYVFDGYGRATSVYTQGVTSKKLYSATTGVYEVQDNVKNNLKEQITVSSKGINYVINGNFDVSGTTSNVDWWDIVGDYELIEDETLEADIIFDMSDQSQVSLSQALFLPAGDYTLTIPITVNNFNDTIISVKMQSIGGSGFSFTQNVRQTDGEFCTSFTIPNYVDGGDKIKLIVEIVGSNTTVKIESIMLEQGTVSSPYNFVQMGSSKNALLYENGNTHINPGAYWVTQDGVAATVTGGGLRLTGDIYGEKFIRQRVYEATDEILNDYDESGSGYLPYDYTISGYLRAIGGIMHERNSDVLFGLRVDVIYYQGEGEEDVVKTYRFSPNQKILSFVCGYVPIDIDYEDPADTASYEVVKAIDIYCEYSNQITGTYAYFDDITFTECDYDEVVKYHYNTEGLLTAKIISDHGEYYEYNSDREIERIANDYGEYTDYFYSEESGKEHLVTCTKSYNFTCGTNDTKYPYDEDDTRAIFRTPLTLTEYTYNQYGLVTEIEQFKMEESRDDPGECVKIEDEPSIVKTYGYFTSAGTRIFGALSVESDGFGNLTSYEYDYKTGRLLHVFNMPPYVGTKYVYDARGNLINVYTTQEIVQEEYDEVTTVPSVEYEYNDKNLLETIISNSTVYVFDYDNFGNRKYLEIGGETILSYEYYEDNEKLHKIHYANGLTVEYLYNFHDLLSEVRFISGGETTTAYTYEYTAFGAVHKFTDYITGRYEIYVYDRSRELSEIYKYSLDGEEEDLYIVNGYDVNGVLDFQSIELFKSIGIFAWGQRQYDYNSNMTIDNYTLVTIMDIASSDFVYDSYGRITGETTTNYDFTITESYTYRTSASNRTDSMVETYSSQVDNGIAATYTYEYNEYGNIISITNEDRYEIRYFYDQAQQLVRVDDERFNTTMLYTYDNAGNILHTHEVQILRENDPIPEYEDDIGRRYTNTHWGDQLTSVVGTNITYDYNGNALHYYNGYVYDFTWIGRRMLSATTSGKTYSFTYDDAGLRTSKTVGQTVTNYYYNGDMLIAEVTDDVIIMYLYDENNLPMGMMYRDGSYSSEYWDMYWYTKNLQGDIVAVYDNEGRKLISYMYDAWGNIPRTIYTNGGASTPAVNNPFKYRGYYYDSDLKMYYLQTRYYDPVNCRFISPDAHVNANGDLVGFNMYMYLINKKYNITQQISTTTNSSNTNGNTVETNCKKTVYFTPLLIEFNRILEPGFLSITNEGIDLISFQYNFFVIGAYLDQEKETFVYRSDVNISLYAGANWEKHKYGVTIGGSLGKIGYDGRFVDITIDFITAKFFASFEDGKLKIDPGFGWIDFGISIDLSEIIRLLRGE